MPPGVLRRPGTGGHRPPLGPDPRRSDRRRRGPRSGPALARHAAYCQCPAAARARLRHGQGRRTHRPGHHPHGALGAEHRLARPRPHGQQDSRHDHREVQRRSGRTEYRGHGRRRGTRHDRGGLRTVPDQGGLPQAHPRDAKPLRWPTNTSASPRREATRPSSEHTSGAVFLRETAPIISAESYIMP